MNGAQKADCPASDTGGHYFEKQDGGWVCTLENPAPGPALPAYVCCVHCEHFEDPQLDGLWYHSDPCPHGCDDSEVTA